LGDHHREIIATVGGVNGAIDKANGPLGHLIDLLGPDTQRLDALAHVYDVLPHVRFRGKVRGTRACETGGGQESELFQRVQQKSSCSYSTSPFSHRYLSKQFHRKTARLILSPSTMEYGMTMQVSVTFFPFFILAPFGAVALAGDTASAPTCIRAASTGDMGAAGAAVGVGFDGGVAATEAGLDGGLAATAVGLENSIAETAETAACAVVAVAGVRLCSKGVTPACNIISEPRLVPSAARADGADGPVP
ncbi:hypothetical protein B484DRAFT_461138, partial [Ochromonadaceae sp. CCMP2298]